ncbi:alpha/beta fold hydrolase [Pseudomonas sp. B21-056]|uniref:alpha/beta fold hydrolase n=1 Tax=Pseudomonas sp. B21-056 TaxID=2895495 RepID=UPI002230EEE1|nr:alpha/beta fold hydrolase [Pseudomonas sp. B21-056]UZE25898.1 alpha/beta fold hydrolase [Pseudomonas sp. B21-056]
MTRLKDSRVSTRDFERLEITVQGVEQVLYTAGTGRPLFYFHGASTFHGFDFARDWINDFKVYVPYHPGFAESADAPHLTSTLDYVAHYKGLLDALGLAKIHLVGCSLGGRLAAEFALTHPEHIESLALLCPAGLDCPEAPMTNLGAISPQELPSYLVEDTSTLAPFLPTTDDPEFTALRARESATVGGLTRHGFRSLLINSTQDPLPAATLLVWGKKDRVIPVDQAYAWLHKFPGIELELLEAVGHLLLDESKTSRQLIASFCSRSN